MELGSAGNEVCVFVRHPYHVSWLLGCTDRLWKCCQVSPPHCFLYRLMLPNPYNPTVAWVRISGPCSVLSPFPVWFLYPHLYTRDYKFERCGLLADETVYLLKTDCGEKSDIWMMQFLHVVCINKGIQEHTANEYTGVVLHGYCFKR